MERAVDDVDALAALDDGPQKPGQRQAKGDVEDVAPDGGAHCHVAKPCLATMTDDIRSGTDVPAAKNV